LDPKFLYYFIASKFKEHIVSKAVSATVSSIRKPMIESFLVSIPPLPVQREIVSILDKFTQLEAELEAELEARRRQYEHYRSELLANSSAREWQQIALGKIATLKYGFTAAAKSDGPYRFLRITDITPWGKLSQSGAKFVGAGSGAQDYLVRPGDLLMARTGATYGKTMLVHSSEDAVFASFLIRVRLDESIMLPSYYWHFAQSEIYWSQVNSMASTGAQPQFNANVLRLVEVPAPPLWRQAKVVSLLDDFDALVNDLSFGLPAEIEARRKQYEYYRDKLLTFKELDAE
jgi:type I restriction enzyme S subunit